MGILIPIIGLCIPLAAIIMSYYYKIEKLKMEANPADNMKIALLEGKIQRLTQEKEQLEKRLDNIEMIVTSSDFLSLPPIDHQAEAQMKAKALAERMNTKKTS